MEWKDLRSLLSSAGDQLRTQVGLTKTVSDILSQTLNFPIARENFEIRNRTIILSGVHPVVKNEVKLKRTEILQQVRIRGLGRLITDVK